MKHSHDDLCDNDAKLADLAWGEMSLELVIASVNIRADQPSLQADWMVTGLQEGNRAAFFNNRIFGADAPSYVKANISWEAVANRTIAAKKTKYRITMDDIRCSFTPLVLTCPYGAIHREYAAYLKWLACRSLEKWEKLFSVVMAWLHAKKQLTIFWAVELCLCGTCVALINFKKLYMHFLCMFLYVLLWL